MVKHNKKILIIATGGGLGATAGIEKVQNPAHLAKEDILNSVEGAKQWDITIHELFIEDSENFSDLHWKAIGDVIYQAFNNYDGFIITHGTDTASFTSSILSYFFQNTSKPIVVTTSTVSLKDKKDYGRIQLQNALSVAGSNYPGVVMCSNNLIISGTSARKHENIYGKHLSVNASPIGVVNRGNITWNASFKVKKGKIDYRPFFGQGLHVQMIYPNFDPSILFHILLGKKPNAFLLVGYGTGCLPVYGDYSLLPFLRECKKLEIPVFIGSRVDTTGTQLEQFRTGAKVLTYDVFPLYEMTLESGIMKILWILGQTTKKAEIKNLFYTNY